MKTLYISDLDGTLLRSDASLSAYTCCTVNDLTEKGILFTYATARSLRTAHSVTKGLTTPIPLILNNGTFVLDTATGKLLLSNFLPDNGEYAIRLLYDAGISPIVYAIIDGKERFSFIPSLATEGIMTFIGSRGDDPRKRMVSSMEELLEGNIFYITCIDEEHKLKPMHDQLKDRYRCLFYREIYSGNPFFEIMSADASKSKAALFLKEYLGCEHMVVFGDGENDADLFRAADRAYAVSNAVKELKDIADNIIDSNDNDAVARWLAMNAV